MPGGEGIALDDVAVVSAELSQQLVSMAPAAQPHKSSALLVLAQKQDAEVAKNASPKDWQTKYPGRHSFANARIVSATLSEAAGLPTCLSAGWGRVGASCLGARGFCPAPCDSNSRKDLFRSPRPHAVSSGIVML